MSRSLVVVAALAALCSLTSMAACNSEPQARAFRITQRAQLIGGPRALGEVNDWMLENGRARFIVQDLGFSRGFGVFGGALLDADLVRPYEGRGDSTGGTGHDNFGEMFPAFFLQALEPGEVNDPNNPGKKLPGIEIESPGGDGKAAVLVVRGTGNDFLALTESINQVLVGDDRQQPQFLFETRYILKPGAVHLEMETTITNITNERREFPNAELLGAAVPTPFGDVVLFGAGNKVFAPHEAGFDLRFRLEDIYKAGDVELPAFPGIVAEFLASASKDVSYGVMAFAPEEPVTNFAYANRDQLPDATPSSVHIPFIASAFTGVFQVLPPPELAPNDREKGGADEMKFRRAFIVGDGDVASISDVVYELLGDKTGTLTGRLTEDLVNRPVGSAHVVVVDKQGRKVTQCATDVNGRFEANLRPGSYDLVVAKTGFQLTQGHEIKVEEGKISFADLVLPASSELVVTIVEPGVGRVPGKVSLLGTSDGAFAGAEPMDFLFDLSFGEPFRYTDLIPDDADDASTRRYIEDFKYGADGVVHIKAPPGKYRVVAGRGTEYSRFEKDIELTPGGQVSIEAVIERVVDTTGYVSADFHLHSMYSLDSAAPLDDRLASYAGEGVELAVSTDHNFVVDYRPTIAKLNLERFISSAVGLELTTIDRGHFNGFPLAVQPGALAKENEDGTFAETGIASRTHGSFQWAKEDPKVIFDALRGLGMKDVNGDTQPVIVQVNHPRDSILGYFDTYVVDPDTLEVLGPEGLLAPNPDNHPEFAREAFSWDFDAVEVFNGKRLELLATYRVPEDAPTLVVGAPGNRRTVHVDPVSCCEVQVGEVLRERPGFPCDDDAIPGDCDTCNAEKFQASLDEGTCDRGGGVAFPGAREDWLRIALTGKKVIGTANSDSHEPEKEEPGYPRTYIRSPVDEPAQLRPSVIKAAFDAGDVLMTNGPFLRVSVDDKGMGSTVRARDGKVTVKVALDTAPWVRVRTLNVFSGVDVVATAVVPRAGKFETEIEVDTPEDTLLVVEAVGTDALFPSIYSNEIPPLQFTDVIGAIGGSFGLGTNPNALRPNLVTVTTAYALTNPIYIDADGGGWDPPTEIPEIQAARADERFALRDDLPTRGRPWVATEEEARLAEAAELWRSMPVRKQIALSKLPRWLWPSNDPRDIRRVLVQFVRHTD